MSIKSNISLLLYFFEPSLRICIFLFDLFFIIRDLDLIVGIFTIGFLPVISVPVISTFSRIRISYFYLIQTICNYNDTIVSVASRVTVISVIRCVIMFSF